MLNLNNFNVKIIGGGRVAFRKAKLLHDNGAKITVVSDKFIKNFDKLKVKRIVRKISDESDIGDLVEKRSLFIIATDDEKINDLIENFCKKNGIIYNRVDKKESDIIFPAFTRYRDITFSISSDGSLPIFSVFLKKKFREFIKDHYKGYSILKKYRYVIKNYNKRKKLFMEILNSDEFWLNVKNKNIEKIKRMLMEGGSNVPKNKDEKVEGE